MTVTAKTGYILPDHKVEYGVMTPIGDLDIDPAVQRTLNAGRSKKMADTFKPTAVGTIVVSQRDDGRRFIVDGMHRWYTCTLVGTVEEMACEVHYGLTQADEAQLFLIKNRESKAPGAYDLYNVGKTAGIYEYVETEKILIIHGLEISASGSSANRVGAAGGFPNIVLTLGPDALDRALDILEGAFGRNQYTWEGNLVYGVSRVVDEYSGKISDVEITKKLRMAKTTAEGLVNEINARARSAVGSSGSGSRRMAGFYVVLDKVNARRKKANLVGPPSYLDAKLGYPSVAAAVAEDTEE